MSICLIVQTGQERVDTDSVLENALFFGLNEKQGWLDLALEGGVTLAVGVAGGQVGYHSIKLLGGSEADAQRASLVGSILGGYAVSSVIEYCRHHSPCRVVVYTVLQLVQFLIS